MAQVRRTARDDVCILTFDNPPVNAFSFAFCSQVLEAIEAAENDGGVRAVVLSGANGLFSGGADVNDFQREPPPNAVNIRHVIACIERSEKVYVAAIDGSALGGAVELALACDYRLATAKSRLGTPEIKLGLLPGAGGTQRLPRLIGAQPALEFMLKGETHDAAKAKALRLIDEVVEGDVVEAAAALAVADGTVKRRVSERKVELGAGMAAFAVPFVIAQAHKMLPPENNGGYAAHKLVDGVQAAFELDFPHGLAREARLFEELVRSQPSQALRHIFFAERELAKIPEIASIDPASLLNVERAGVIGAGTMGTGIAIAFANAGIPVTVVEPSDEQIERAKQMVFGMFMHQVQRGRLTQEEAWKRGQSIAFTSDYKELAGVDLAIEAVFESMEVKKRVFAQLDAIVKPEAILASNTSTLDIDEMAAVTKRPAAFLGLHFFAPANIMKLLEIVRGKQTSPQALASAFALAKRLRKVAVLSGNAFGFIGNRMLFDYAREAVELAEGGVPPYRIDEAMKDFGFAMGPFAMFDLSGIDVMWHIAQARPEMSAGRTPIVQRLVEQKRLGQKTGAGFYRYEKGSREPLRDPQIEELIANEAAQAKIAQRPDVSDAEIVKRLTGALSSRGTALLEEGVALRPGDIDITYIYGYGFPPHRGGPMWYAKEQVHA